MTGTELVLVYTIHVFVLQHTQYFFYCFFNISNGYKASFVWHPMANILGVIKRSFSHWFFFTHIHCPMGHPMGINPKLIPYKQVLYPWIIIFLHIMECQYWRLPTCESYSGFCFLLWPPFFIIGWYCLAICVIGNTLLDL